MTWILNFLVGYNKKKIPIITFLSHLVQRSKVTSNRICWQSGAARLLKFQEWNLADRTWKARKTCNFWTGQVVTEPINVSLGEGGAELQPGGGWGYVPLCYSFVSSSTWDSFWIGKTLATKWDVFQLHPAESQNIKIPGWADRRTDRRTDGRRQRSDEWHWYLCLVHLNQLRMSVQRV